MTPDKNATSTFGAVSPAEAETLDWGLLDYREACRRQEERVSLRLKKEARDALIFVEHPPVYTIGVRRGARDHLVWDEERRSRLGIATVETNRGGDITYHGPGQVVGYPIVHLRHLNDLHAYLRLLEMVLIEMATGFGLPVGRREGFTGIWVGNRKLAAIGVGVRRWVAFHGFAVNVSNDLEPFQGIVPCGLSDAEVTSLRRELGKEIDPEEVKAILTVEFWRLFSETTRL